MFHPCSTALCFISAALLRVAEPAIMRSTSSASAHAAQRPSLHLTNIALLRVVGPSGMCFGGVALRCVLNHSTLSTAAEPTPVFYHCSTAPCCRANCPTCTTTAPSFPSRCTCSPRSGSSRFSRPSFRFRSSTGCSTSCSVTLVLPRWSPKLQQIYFLSVIRVPRHPFN